MASYSNIGNQYAEFITKNISYICYHQAISDDPNSNILSRMWY
jgi:hypothetical protein